MVEGVTVELSELLALQRFVYSAHYRPLFAGSRAGNHLSRLRGRGMGFAEARNYKAGDEIRHMEWRITARTGKPHVKVYHEERERPVVILTDFNPSMYFGTRIAFKSVIAAKLCAMLAWTAIKQKDRVGGLFFSALRHDEFLPRARESGVLPMLATVCQYTQEYHTVMKTPRILSHALMRLRRVAKPGSIVVLISDFYTMDEESEKHLSRIIEHNDVLAYLICDPLELTLPTLRQYVFTNGHDHILLDTTDNTAYQTYCEKRLLHLNEQFRRLQIELVQVTSDMDIPLLVRQTFPRRRCV